MNFGVFFHSCPFSYVAHSRKGSAKGSDRGLGERAAWVEHVGGSTRDVHCFNGERSRELSVMLDCTNVSLLGGSFHLKMIRFVCVFDYHHLYAAVLFFFFLVNFLSFYFKSTFVFLISSRATVVAVAAFLDAFQKVADLATNSRGRKFQCVAGSSILHQTYCSSLTRQTALLTGIKLLRHCLTVYVSYYSCVTVFV